MVNHNKNMGNLLEYLGTHFLICNEKIPGYGEDSGIEIYTLEAGIIGVFDGCGGLGSKICPSVAGKTEAYLASRSVANAVRQWFQCNSMYGYTWDTEELKDTINYNLSICQEKSSDTGGIKFISSMIRPFPTTIAVVTFQIFEGKLHTNHFWAGDSRTFVLDYLGLGQISVDDIDGEDAMSNLTSDGALTNVLSSDKKYAIHKVGYETTAPAIFLSSSDGCFGYVSSPMEFELLILSTLEESKNVEEWKVKLSEVISSKSGDDQTLSLAAFGFSSFEELQKHYLKRYKLLLAVIRKFENSDATGKQLLWDEYKTNYYRHSARKA